MLILQPRRLDGQDRLDQTNPILGASIVRPNCHRAPVGGHFFRRRGGLLALMRADEVGTLVHKRELMIVAA